MEKQLQLCPKLYQRAAAEYPRQLWGLDEIEQSQMEMSPIAGDVVAWQHIEIQIRENGDRWCMRMARAVAKRGSGCKTKWVGVSYMDGLALMKYALAATRQRQLIWFTFHFRLPCKLQQHLRTYTPIHLYTFTMHMCRCHTHTHTLTHTGTLESSKLSVMQL